MTKQAIIEAVKEGLRIAFLAAVVALVGWAGEQVSSLDPTSTYYIAGTFFLRLIDRFIHTNENISIKGIAPF